MSDVNILNVSGVECYEKDGTVFLKLEDVARGLGFTFIATSGNEVVRWNRVEKYLSGLNVPTSGHGDFIPENVFYRLAMKAKNEVAERFQAKVADEIIPSIRKHGAYMTENTLEKALTSPDFLIQLATRLKEEQEKNKVLQLDNERMKPKEIYADAVAVSNTTILIGELAKVICQNGVQIGQNRLFKWLRDNGYLFKGGEQHNLPTQKSMNLGLMVIKQSTSHNPDGSSRINRTPKVTGKGQLYFVNKFLGKKGQQRC